MKKQALLLVLATVTLTACGSSLSKNEETSSQASLGSGNKVSSEDESQESHNWSSEESVNSGTDNSAISNYSAAEIEYARVWLEVIGNKEVEELNVSSIPAGEPLNIYEAESSAVYPEAVVVLSGKIMADGSVVYSGNGDGTINLYEVPSHWQEGVVPEGKTMLEYTTDIATNPVLVPISVGNEEDVISLINNEVIHSNPVIVPFTAENAFAYLREQEGFNEDLVLEYASYQAADNYYELVIVSRSLKAQGGSGTVGIYHVYEDGQIVDTYAD